MASYSQDRVFEASGLLQLVQRSPWIPEKPFHGPGHPLNHAKQAEFLVAPEKEVLFGGAAGGGKSTGLLAAALMFAEVPGYTALILRKSFPQLEMTLMKQAFTWLGPTAARWNDGTKTWTFPSGATVRFGHMGHKNARFDYQGAEFDCVVFDELTQHEQTDYEYLFSRLRRKEGSLIPPRMRATSNPGGTGHAWVEQKFMIERKAGERRYLPATLDDNPHLDKVEYERSLRELDPVTYDQLRWGRWDVTPTGGWFRSESFEVVDVHPPLVRMIRFWDLAGTEERTGGDPDWTVGCLVGVDREGLYWVIDVRRFREAPAKQEALIRDTAQLDGKGVEIFMEQEPGSSGKIVADHYRRRVLPGFAYWAEPSSGPKTSRARPAAAAAAGGLIKVVRAPWNRAFIEELRLFPQKGYHDDQVDAFSGAFSKLATGSGAAFADAWEQMSEGEAEPAPDAEAVSQVHQAAEANRMLRRLPRQMP